MAEISIQALLERAIDKMVECGNGGSVIIEDSNKITVDFYSSICPPLGEDESVTSDSIVSDEYAREKARLLQQLKQFHETIRPCEVEE